MSSKSRIIIYSILIIILLILGGFLFLTVKNSVGIVPPDPTAQLTGKVTAKNNKSVDIGLQKPLPNPPSVIRAVYLTSWSGGSKSRVQYVLDLARESAINAVVIDIKDYSGYLAYEVADPEISQYRTFENRIPRVNALVKTLHDAGVYVIGRITVFQDPMFAHARPDLAVHNLAKMNSTSSDAFKSVNSLWQDEKKLNWMDPAAKGVWEYNAAIARDAAERGFDEVNFDYVRFPSGGNLDAATFPFWDKKTPRYEVIKNFFKYLRSALPNVKLSADLFGFAAIRKDDLGIGQRIEDAFSYFDYLSPMVYPSHYDSGFHGFTNPAAHPYEVISYSLKEMDARRAALLSAASTQSSESIAKIRPWLQDFDLNGVPYDAAMVGKEIQATKDSLPNDYAGFMLWSPTNVYTKDALLGGL